MPLLIRIGVFVLSVALGGLLVEDGQALAHTSAQESANRGATGLLTH